MMNSNIAAARRRLSTPRAAAVAGILFAVLFSASLLLMRFVLPEDLSGPNAADWLAGNTSLITLALTLVPFAGIAFLWFMGVVRSHLGELEDQLFSTVMFGSALLFLGMVFVSAALAGGIITSSYGGCLHDLARLDLDANAAHAAPVGVADLRAGAAVVDHQQLIDVDRLCLSGVGFDHQYFHSASQPAESELKPD
jgi:Zn-dependent protease with chaperone function